MACSQSGQIFNSIPENRRYFDPNNRTNYRSGFGYPSSDAGPSYPELGVNSILKPSIEIFEPNNCADSEGAENPERKTVLRLRRIFFPTPNDQTAHQDEIVDEVILRGFNPMCLESSSTDPRLNLNFKHNRIDLRCRYGFSRGVGQFVN